MHLCECIIEELGVEMMRSMVSIRDLVVQLCGMCIHIGLPE